MSETRIRNPELLHVDDETPGRRLAIADLMLGDAVEQRFAFDEESRIAFGKVANDRAPLHADSRFADTQGFRSPIVQGLCVSTRFSRLIGMYIPGEYAILERIDLRFRHPTYEGQHLYYRVEVVRLLQPLRVVRVALSARSDTATHVTGEAQCLIR